ncbi:MAG TPA: universal stress protein [Steroidobacteraceae bacterium]|nr:universal stress protein [Steroidobacteraceae bacterium]
MEQPNHLLVVVDPTVTGRQSAVDKALILARPLGATVELLLCDMAREGGDGAGRPGEPQGSLAQHQDLLEALAVLFRERHTEVSTRVAYGDSLHRAILDYVRQSNATMVIKDTHHHSLARRTFLRNTDWHLAHGSPVPLLLTKNNEWCATPVIMAAIEPDPSKKSVTALNRKILSCATSLAACMSGDLHVIHTYIPTALAAASGAEPLRMTADLAGSLECETSFRLGQLQSLARLYGVPPARLHVQPGAPEHRIVDLVSQYKADVIVIGASSHGRWHRMIIGSTASSVLESLTCDILVVRPDPIRD